MITNTIPFKFIIFIFKLFLLLFSFGVLIIDFSIPTVALKENDFILLAYIAVNRGGDAVG